MLNKLKCLLGLHDWTNLIDVVGTSISGRMCRNCLKKQKAYIRFK